MFGSSLYFDSFASRCVVLVLAFVVVHTVFHFPLHNQRDNTATQAYGEAILESMPRDALVLVNGDINNNLVKYPQQCDGVRTDLRIMSLQLMTWYGPYTKTGI
jgi:hypothetical protein